MAIALVVGCAENVWDDAARAYEMFTPDAVVAVKNMIYLWPGRVDYGINLHPDRTLGYLRQRAELKRKADFEVWAHRAVSCAAIVHRTTTDWQGGTGLFAVKVAVEEGFDGIVLAGIPMDPNQGHIVRRKKWMSAQMFQKGWKTHFGSYEARTRSLSGWTQELLGDVDADWLKSRSALPPNPEWARLLKETGDASITSSPREARRAS